MKHTLRSLLLLAVTSVMATQAHAQVVTYHFTGHVNAGDSTAVGNTIIGTLTLDLGAPPTYSQVFDDFMVGIGQYAQWDMGLSNSTVTITTDKGFKITNGSLQISVYDVAGGFLQFGSQTSMYSESADAAGITGFDLNTRHEPNGDGIASIPTPWNPLGAEYFGINISFMDFITGTYERSDFIIDTFGLGAPPPANIVIDGADTGIKDFNYQGQSVAAILADYATNAKNHGDYVEKVEKLAEKLVKAKLLTKAQAKTLTQAAEKSDIGKKPKKDKEKDDKDKEKDKNKDNDDGDDD